MFLRLLKRVWGSIKLRNQSNLIPLILRLFGSMKFNQKQIIYTLYGLLVGITLAFGGVLTSGAGHGSSPLFSIMVAAIGGVIIILSFVLLVGLLMFGLLGKNGFPIESDYVREIPGYNWRCPKCGTVVQVNSSDCLKCGC